MFKSHGFRFECVGLIETLLVTVSDGVLWFRVEALKVRKGFGDASRAYYPACIRSNPCGIELLIIEVCSKLRKWRELWMQVLVEQGFCC